MTELKRNVIQVRHLQQPPYGLIVADELKVNKKEIVTTHKLL
ncbi:MAG: hypothetical protein ACTSRZ_12490 [Promethearchaeota archaeon]